MKYFSLFSGIGGFELGIQQAYENLDVSNRKRSEQGRVDIEKKLSMSKYRSLAIQQPNCVGYSEIDKYAIQIYEKHFKHKNYGDITKIEADRLPDFELLCGGFPCQSFSIAGKRGGFEDTRGTLFFDIARIAKAKRPRLLFLENVKGLLSHDEGRTFNTIITTLDELGYDVQWQVLNSKNFGVPQNRERVFIIGHLRGTSRPKIFPFRGSNKEVNQTKKLREQVSNTLRTNYSNGRSNETYIGELPKDETKIINKQGKTKKDQNNVSTLTGGGHSGGNHSDMDLIQLNQPKHSNDRIYGEKGISPTLNTAQGGNRQPFVAMKWQRTEKGKEARKKSQKGGKDYTPFSDGHRELAPSDRDAVGALTSQAIAKDSLVGSGMQIRRLTPIECERLQGFPDGWTKGISDTQRYKCLGNAVTVNVIKEITKRLI